MRRLAIALLFAALPAFAQEAGDVVSPEIGFFEAGIVCAPPAVRQEAAPGTLAGVIDIIEEDAPFVSLSRRVPAVRDLSFGVRAQAARQTFLFVTIEVTHPPMGPDGVTRQTYGTAIGPTAPSLTFYSFDFDYELLPGAWTISAIADGKLLYRAAFTVLRPEEVPELAAVCGYEDLLS